MRAKLFFVMAVALTFLVLVSPAKAQFTADQLYKLCTTGDPEGETICRNWVSGFTEGMMNSQTREQKNIPPPCFPNGVTADEAILIVKKFMQEHPQDLHAEAGVISGLALLQAFPCNK
jgi:hypothetical protein